MRFQIKQTLESKSPLYIEPIPKCAQITESAVEPVVRFTIMMVIITLSTVAISTCDKKADNTTNQNPSTIDKINLHS